MALKEARKALGISQEELSFRADMNRTYISHIERGAKNIAVDNMERLAEAVGRPLWMMLRPEDERRG